ncbi:hypothetical protein GCM10008983_08360 [Lentibacillus halophilus]|uniref:MgtC/SapB/SrpB/YhiD N-terminal domain-containing protein n=1 Tax=Lentibacillus halophilus TaxID=295065 RepID=A0ABN0Z5M8_9BACI
MDGYWDLLVGDHFVTIMIRIVIALILSGLIGFERELKNHSAGFRTHILVGVGACLMMVLSLYGFEWMIDAYDNIRFDPARIPSYVISGIGFLGAGTIIVNGMTIRGLTTAASIWTVAGLGLVVGAGMYASAVFTTVIILLSLVFLNNFEKVFKKGKSSYVVEIIAMPGLELNHAIGVFEHHQLVLKRVEISRTENDLRHIFITVDPGEEMDRSSLFEDITKLDYIKHAAERK